MLVFLSIHERGGGSNLIDHNQRQHSLIRAFIGSFSYFIIARIMWTLKLCLNSCLAIEYAVIYGTQNIASSNSPSRLILNLRSIDEGNFSETVVQPTGNQHSNVLVETSNNGSHLYIFPHSGFGAVDVNWLHLGKRFNGTSIQQGQFEMHYSTQTLCNYFTFATVSWSCNWQP